jgi:hypothetical protein
VSTEPDQPDTRTDKGDEPNCGGRTDHDVNDTEARYGDDESPA